MRIIDKTSTTVEFSSLKVGDCFLYDSCLFVKMNPVKPNDRAANAYCFVDNTIVCISQDWSVTLVDAEIIIHSKGVD